MGASTDDTNRLLVKNCMHMSLALSFDSMSYVSLNAFFISSLISIEVYMSICSLNAASTVPLSRN